MLRQILLILALVVAGNAVAADAPATLELQFDYEAVEDFLRAANREALDEERLQRIAAGRGSRAMVRNTNKYLPDVPLDGYPAALRELAARGGLGEDPYYLADALEHRAELAAFVLAIKREAPAMSERIVRRLQAHWSGEPPLVIRVYLVVGGSSDGFVLDGDNAPDFFIAIDKAAGDLAGLEQNIGHESVHVMQRQKGLRHCPGRPSIEIQALPARFATTVYEEGVANYLADPRQVEGEGAYIGMWRGRYERNASPERMRENLWLYHALRAGLASGQLSWDTAYQLGFSGTLDSRLYFVGRDMARRLESSGKAPLATEFICRPEAFLEAGEADRSKAR